jgi:WD40 repeat protein
VIAALASEAWRVAPNSDAWNAFQRLPWTGSETSTEHKGDVTVVRFSPDASVLASASVDGAVKLIDVSSGVVRRSFAHEGWVNALAFSHDGRFFASGSGNSARIFRTDGSGEQQMLSFKGPVHAVAFDPSGRFFTGGSDDHSVLITEMANGSVRVRLHQEDAVRALTFSPDGSLLAIGDWHGVVKLVSTATMNVVAARRITDQVSSGSGHINQIAFDPMARQPFVLAVAADDGARILAATGSLGELIRLPEVGGAVNAIAFSPDGLLIAEGGNDRAVRIARSEDGVVLTTVLHGGRVNDVAFSRDGRWLATGSGDSFVRLVEVPREERPESDPNPRAPVRAAISNGKDEVTTVAFSPDGRFLATGSRDHRTRIFPIRAGLAELRWLPAPAETLALAFSPDGRYLGVGDGTGAAVYDISSGKQLTRLGHGDGVHSIAFSPDKRWVAFGDDQGTVEVRSANGGDAIPTSGMNLSEPVSNVSFSADGRFLGITGLMGTIRLVTTANWQHSDFVHADENVFVAGFSPKFSRELRTNSDSLYFVAGAEPYKGDGVIRRWQLDSQTSPRELPPISPGHWIRGLSFAPDGRHAVVGTNAPEDHPEVVVIQLDTGQEVSRLPGGPVVAASRRGDLIATGTAYGTVTVATLSGRRQRNLLDRVGRVATLAFSPDSELLAVGDGDGAVRVLRVRDGVEAIRITHNGGVSVLAFSPDGTIVATGGDTRDRSVRLWSTDADRLVRDLCTGPGRNPDLGDWRRFFGNLAWKRTCPVWLPKDVSVPEK